MSDRLLTLDLLFAFLAFTLAMTYWASRATKTAADFYVASHKLRPWQNGIAMSGAFISAVTVLGVPGLIALTGYDGVYYFVGTLLSFVVVQALVAEPFRNAGRFTLADALVPRLRERPVRLAMATSTISVAIIYMVAQIIGAGVLARLLLPLKGTVLGLPPETLAIVVVGLLMTIHVAYGGMLLITWVQIVKVVVLLLGVIVTALVVLGRFGFSFDQLFATATQRSGKGSAYLGPGLRFTNPIDQVSLGIALVLGTAGLPHIMVRLYTVPDARAARKSVSWAIGSVGLLFAMAAFLGFGAAALIGSKQIASVDEAGNATIPLLVRFLGGGDQTFGGDLFLGLMAVIVFATILGVVAALMIAATASFAHDVWASVIHHGEADEAREVRVARRSALVIGPIAIALAVALRRQNVAPVAVLAFAVAASSTFPVLLLSIYWKRFNTDGALAGILGGLSSSLFLMAIGPTVMGPKGFLMQASTPLFPLENPGIVSIPIGFLAAYLGTVVSQERITESRVFQALRLKTLTGLEAGNGQAPPAPDEREAGEAGRDAPWLTPRRHATTR
jgi:cation/acetate symporter